MPSTNLPGCSSASARPPACMVAARRDHMFAIPVPTTIRSVAARWLAERANTSRPPTPSPNHTEP